MINSMTGFGRAQSVCGGREITVEIRAVNHRYFEFSSRIPRAFSFVEEKIKAHVQSRVARGKTEVSVTVINSEDAAPQVELNMALAKNYADALQRLSDELGLKNDITPGAISRYPDVFTVKKEVDDEEQVWADIRGVLDRAIDSFHAMRAAEGKRLYDDIAGRLDFIEEAVGTIEKTSAPRLEKYREKLYNRMKTVLEGTDIDDSRILLEAAIYADKSAIDEETVRLRSHLAQYRSILQADEPVGRKLDFLTQEVNREVNTIGSKAGDLEITALVVDVKAEIEKIREQIQNVE